jgi:DNA-binding response OmpR family regulator
VAIVLDLSMPGMDGRDFYRRARNAGFRGPIVIISAFGSEDAKQELGADAALAKPFEPEALASTVVGVIARH